MSRRHVRLLVLVGVVVVLVAAACGNGTDPLVTSPPGGEENEPLTSTEVVSIGEIEHIEVECATPDGDEVRVVTTRQELAFDGTVTAISAERNVSAGHQHAFVDDGEVGAGEAPDSRDVSEPDPEDPDAGEIWPWTTFEVYGWYSFDAGTEISIWTAGLELNVGDRWLISGQAFATPDGLGDHDAQSGMAAVCASEPHSESVAAEWDEWFGGTVAPGVAEPEGEADPAAVEEIEAGRIQWIETGTDRYTATIRVFTGSLSDNGECSATGSSVRVVVEDGEVTDAVDLEQGCRIDADTTTVLTIDDLFDLAITASAATEEFGYEIDPIYGYPRFFFGYDRSLEVDGSVQTFTPRASQSLLHEEIPEGINDMRSQWEAAGLTDYQFVVEWQCFCGPDVTGPFVVTVMGGEQRSIERSDGSPIDLTRIPKLPETLDEFFDLIESKQTTSDLVIAGFDTELGFPTDVFIDEIRNAIDDELTVVVTAFDAE